MYKSCLTSVDYLIYCTPPPHHSGKYLRNITSHRNVKGYWRAEAGASVRIMVWVQQCTPSILWRVGGPALTKTAIQPLAVAEMLGTAQQVPGLQELTLQEVQEAHSSIKQQGPFEILERLNEADAALQPHKQQLQAMETELPVSVPWIS
ncbi:hypothetical protein Pcinc_033089 [Petrolisthes cinctipes]|uniref:Uncharacterized protein n=1 Tax=Petrolisthes cinctipes TaxID=88211 RepID=A0AAE1K033_PETCI|nr:hypothetical protein Pcinc_033089 [Petrolisthes cinctipes]